MPLFSKLAAQLERLAGTQTSSSHGLRSALSYNSPSTPPSSGSHTPSTRASYQTQSGATSTSDDEEALTGTGSSSGDRRATSRTSCSRSPASVQFSPEQMHSTLPAPHELRSAFASHGGGDNGPTAKLRRSHSISYGLLKLAHIEIEEFPLGPKKGMRRNSVSGAPRDTLPHAAQSESPLIESSTGIMTSEEQDVLTGLQTALDAHDTNKIQSSIESFLKLDPTKRTLVGFNNILSALRRAGSLASSMLRIYREMQAHGPPPNATTYVVLIDALCTRDMELHTNPSDRTVLPEGSEDDFLVAALTLAQAAHAMHLSLPSTAAYNMLLQCCAMRGKTREAVEVLALLEENVLMTKDADSFRLLIQVFAHDTELAREDETETQQQSRRIKACIEVFETFERVASALAIIQPGTEAFSKPRCQRVWATMLDAHFTLGDAAGAVSLFERLIAAQPYGMSTPPVDEQIISTMVLGFVRAGDIRSAVEWLHHLQDSELPQPSVQALEGVLAAVMQQPPTEAAHYLNPVGEALLARPVLLLPIAAKCLLHLATVLEKRKVWKQLSDDEIKPCLDTLRRLADKIFSTYSDKKPLKTKQQTVPVAAILRLIGQLTFVGRPGDAAAFFRLAVLALRHADTTAPCCVALLCDACHLPMAIADAALQQPHTLSDACVRLTAMVTLVAPALEGMRGSLLDGYYASLTHLYEAASRDLNGDMSALALSEGAWRSITDAFCAEELAATHIDTPTTSTGLGKLLAELAQLPVNAPRGAARRPMLDVARLSTLLRNKYGEEGLVLLHAWLSPDDPAAAAPAKSGPKHAKTTSEGKSVAAEAVAAPHALHAYIEGVHSPNLPAVRNLDGALGGALQSLARAHGQLQADELYARLKSSVGRGTYAAPGALAVLINAFGRMGQLGRIDELYAMGMHVLASRPNEHEWRVSHWFQLEDGMITALSHAGAGERANAHRERLVAAGHVPSASAYAALIATIQERTDDAVVAEELFGESQRLGVRPTTYLYNTVISKLSRARKAEQALRLFDAMRSANLRPSSVTYGAAINACVRTGDEARATQLFAEMESQQTFQPRVPPYNTMIQYYVHSCMDRDKALHYYEKMQQAGVRPSAHTYKLLLDVWGSIAPVQPERQQAVFARLVADRLVGVQGTHWASLLHTQGTVLHDLDRALETFESIAEHAPAGPRNGISTVPDAVVYESLFSVFVAHGRTDLMPAYLARMVSQGILPTAYIANLLIKGYAQDGPLGLVEARRVFDAMIDPPAGIAAAGNHLPRHHGAGALGMRRERVGHGSRGHAVDRANVLGALVNREPSTYEAMIRAELSYGHQDRASALFEKMKARAFPVALIHRARALFDHVGPRATA